jgi:gamma-glutamylcyclotransferase (GGCT)/AIG2-like uncharacterized protein YtfP
MTSGATVEPLPIFVYGTLLEGQPNSYVWRDNYVSVEAAVCRGGRLMDCGFFPIMVDGPGYSVVGQLFHVKPQRFAAIIHALDVLEGFNPRVLNASMFRREEREVVVNGGDSTRSLTYVGSKELAWHKLPAVPGGDWPRYRASRSR